MRSLGPSVMKGISADKDLALAESVEKNLHRLKDMYKMLTTKVDTISPEILSDLSRARLFVELTPVLGLPGFSGAWTANVQHLL